MKTIASISVPLVLAACTSVTLYNEDRDKAATAALEAVNNADLKAYAEIRTQRQNHLRDEHIAISSRLAELQATDAVRELLSMPARQGLFTEYLSKPKVNHWAAQPEVSDCSDQKGIVAQRYCALGVADKFDVVVLQTALEAKLLSYNPQVSLETENLRGIVGGLTPTCEGLSFLQTPKRRQDFGDLLVKSAPEAKHAAAATAFQDLSDACDQQITAFDRFATRMIEKALQTKAGDRGEDCIKVRTSIYKTEIAQQICNLWEADQKIVAAKAAVSAVAGELKAASKKLADATPASFDEDAFDKVLEKAKGQAESVVAAAREVVDTVGVSGGTTIAAFDAVSALLTAATTGEANVSGADSATVKQAQTLFAAFPSMAKKFGVLGAASQKPASAKLAIAEGILRIRQKALLRELDVLESRRTLELKTLSALMGQVYALSLAKAEKGDVCSTCSLTPLALLNSKKDGVRRATYIALAQVWYAITKLEEPRKSASWSRSNLHHREIGALRDQVLAETKFLASGGAEDLAEFHKSGLKREEIVSLVGRLANLALLGGILDETD